MVGKYARRSTRQSWDEAAKQRTVDAVKKQDIGWLGASKAGAFHRLRFIGEPGIKQKHSWSPQGTRPFSSYILLDLLAWTSWSLETSGVTFVWLDRIKRACWSVGRESGIEHRFGHEKRNGGWNWVVGFKNRNETFAWGNQRLIQRPVPWF
jgi:hypothetical protein